MLRTPLELEGDLGVFNPLWFVFWGALAGVLFFFLGGGLDDDVDDDRPVLGSPGDTSYLDDE